MKTFSEFMNIKKILCESAMTPEEKAAKKIVKQQVLEKFAHLSPEEMLPLPEKYDLYFKMDNSNTKIIPIKDLTNIRAREEGIKNALTMMYAASIGQSMGLGKRVPISVKELGHGKYEIFDGNSTFNIAKQSNWNSIPALVVDEHGNYV